MRWQLLSQNIWFLFALNKVFWRTTTSQWYFSSPSVFWWPPLNGMALMERVYSRRWHLLSPRPTPFSSLSPFKRFSSWSTVPQTSSSGCSAVFSLFSLFCKPADKCLFKVVPNGGWSVEKCVWCPNVFRFTLWESFETPKFTLKFVEKLLWSELTGRRSISVLVN